MSRGRGAYSALELLVVLSIVTSLVALAVVGAVPAMRKGRLNQSGGQVVEVLTDAMMESRKLYGNEGHYWGVRLVGNESPNRVALIKGTYNLASPGTITGITERHSRKLGPSVQFFQGDDPMDGSNGTDTTYDFWCQPVTGFPFDPATEQPISVGTGDPGTPQYLSLRTLDQEFQLHITIHEMGICHIETVE